MKTGFYCPWYWVTVRPKWTNTIVAQAAHYSGAIALVNTTLLLECLGPQVQAGWGGVDWWDDCDADVS